MIHFIHYFISLLKLLISQSRARGATSRQGVKASLPGHQRSTRVMHRSPCLWERGNHDLSEHMVSQFKSKCLSPVASGAILVGSKCHTGLWRKAKKWRKIQSLHTHGFRFLTSLAIGLRDQLGIVTVAGVIMASFCRPLIQLSPRRKQSPLWKTLDAERKEKPPSFIN